MNKVILVGRLTKDPELRSTPSGVNVCSFSVACDRRFVKEGEERKADFINCIVWRQTAEFVSKYFRKGHRIALEGSLQTRDYTDKDGKKCYVTEVVVGDVEFCQSKSENTTDSNFASNTASTNYTPEFGADFDGFLPISDEDMPF